MTGDNDVPGSRLCDFVEQVLDQAWRQPDAIATAGPAGRLTYAELEALSARVAQELIEAGVQPGAVVGVCLDQSERLPAVLLGVARIGAASLPLDLGHPLDRLEYQVTDAGTGVLVAAGAGLDVATGLADRVAGGVQVIDVDSAALPTDVAPPRVPVGAEGLAYLIYTSGSSGQPKGVEVTRGNLAVHLDGIAQTFPMTPQDVMTTLAGVSFDITHLGIWGPLTTGGTCVLLEETSFVDGYALAGHLASAGVSILQATPTTLRTLMAGGWQGHPGIRVMSGGEALAPALARDLLPVVGELWNFYGPTETTIWATAQRLTEADLAPVPIGRPLPHYRVAVLGEDGQPVRRGAAGELWIAGPGVGRGYRGRPDLTAEVFAEDPGHPGERRYRTGDRVRELGNGALEFLGRTDHQVTVRGHRVELGEIESWLRAGDAVTDAAVTVAGDGAGAHLVGHVVWRGKADERGLRGFLTERLPDHMVPHRWTRLDALPVLPSGKVDRAALPGPARAVLSRRADEQGTMIEEFIAKTWREVLGVTTVRRGDSFFELGGHAFAGTSVVGRLRPVLGCRVPVRVLFEHPVLEDFAVEVDRIALEQLAWEVPVSAGGRA